MNLKKLAKIKGKKYIKLSKKYNKSNKNDYKCKNLIYNFYI